MKRPGFFTYLIGNPLSALGLIAFSCFLLYQWWIGQMTNIAPFVAVCVFGTAMNASQKITDYSLWKRSWNAMGGVSHAARWTWLRFPALVVAWLVGAVAAATLDPRRPETQYVVFGFTLATMLIGGVMLYHIAWRFRRRPRRQKEVLVTISLRVPSNSPGPKQFYKGVPAYCAKLSAQR